MSQPEPGAPSRKAIAEALDRSKVLNATAKRHWRSLLPHMDAADLQELWQILVGAERELSQLDERSREAERPERGD